VLPLVILGVVSVVGGLSGLRLPETLHHRLPQTVEDGEEFGKDWTLAECLRCIPVRHVIVIISFFLFIVSSAAFSGKQTCLCVRCITVQESGITKSFLLMQLTAFHMTVILLEATLASHSLFPRINFSHST